MDRRLYLELFLLPLCLVLLGFPGRVSAQNDAPPGVDIVFVVDQSGTMSRGAVLDNNAPGCKPPRTEQCKRGPASDPDALAIEALKDGLDPIVESIVRRSKGRVQVGLISEEYNFGVILFGGDRDAPDGGIKVPIPLTRITINTDANGNLRSNIEDQFNQVLAPYKNPDSTKRPNLGETAFSRAFDEVCALLECQFPTPPNRKQVVVLLTDVGPPSEDDIPFSEEHREAYFNQLLDRHKNLFERPGSELWVLGLGKNAQYWNNYASYWKQITPHIDQLTQPTDIAPKFSEIARDAIGEPPGEPHNCDSSIFKVAPYLASLTLVLEYPDTNTKALFTLPTTGITLTKDSAQSLHAVYTRSRQSETFVIKNPPPGDWSCKVIDGSVETKFRDVRGLISLTDVNIERAAGSASTCSDFGIVVSYRDSDNNPIMELPDYPLQQMLSITIDGHTMTRQLIPDDASHQQWKADSSLRPGPSGGVYPVSVDVRLKDGTAVFSNTSQTITIDPKLPCMEIVAPKAGTVSEMHHRLTEVGAEFVVQMTQGGKPGTPTNVFREDLSQIVSGHLEGPRGFSRTVQLQLVPDQPGQFIGKVDGLQAAGVYTFTAGLLATTQDGKRYELAPQAVTFKRVPGAFFELFQLTLRIVVLVVLGVLLTLFGFYLFLITGPYPKGTLLLEQRTTGDLAEVRPWTTIKSIPLSAQRRFFGLFRTRWPKIKKGLPKMMGLRAIKVRRLVSGRDEGVSITLVRDDKKIPISMQFTRHQQARSIEGNYRITYENFGSQRKKR